MIARLLTLLLLVLPLAACGQVVPETTSHQGQRVAPATEEPAASDDAPATGHATATPDDEHDRSAPEAGAEEPSASELMATTSRCGDASVGYEIAHPADWATNDDGVLPSCRLFDPDSTEAEPGTEIPLGIAVSLRTSRQPLSDLVEDDDGATLLDRRTMTVDGHDAVAVEKRSNGEALVPDGARFSQHVVDLGRIRLVASTFDVDARYETHREVLAAMVDSLRLGATDDSTQASEVTLPDSRQVCSPEHPGTMRIELAHPSGWQVEDGVCRHFDPALQELPEDTEPDVAMSVRVAQVDFEDALAPGPGTRDEVTYVGAVAGRPLVRVRAVATGQAGRPRGAPVLHYLVDLGGDDGSGTLVASAHASQAASFQLAARALDSTMRTLLVSPQSAASEAIVVTRRATGPTPYAVTYDHDCFRLHRGGATDAAVDEACDVTLDDDRLGAALLEDGDLEVAAGLASPRAAFVVSDAASAPYGAVTTSLEGASAFAYELVGDPTEVRALDLRGEVLAATSP